MPGPMAACARSTGAMFAALEMGQGLTGNSDLRAATNSRRVAPWCSPQGAWAADQDDAGGEGVGIHTDHTITKPSVRIGHVPLIPRSRP